ncbi:YbhN family protein [Muricomes intestini]|uniref:lysylphosphatidylglycerol synthase transmembrane domain-containing protein n=1 Tax=Muricomes intestini TaxID=1796634 RepID=UPI002FE2F3A4
MKKGLSKIWRPAFFVLVILIIYMVFKDSWGDIWGALKNTSWKVLAGVVICSVLYYCFDGVAVTKLLRSCDDKFPWNEGIKCSFYYSFFRVVTFGSGTAAAGMYYVSKRGIPAVRSLGIFTLNYIVQRIAVCLYFIFSFLGNYQTMHRYFGGYGRYMLYGVALAVLVVAALIIFCICEPLHTWAFGLLEKVVRKEKNRGKIAEWKERAGTLRTEAQGLLKDKKLLLEVLLLNFLKLSAWYLIPAVVFGKMESLRLPLLMATTSMVQALSGVIPAPGGVGAVEFVFASLFTTLVGSVDAVSGMLLYRFSTYILPFVLGIPLVLKNSRRKK